MANIRRRDGKWQVQIRRRGLTPLSKTFHNRVDAVAWARQKELQADRQELHPDTKILEELTLADLVERYRDEVSVLKRGGDIETVILNAFLKHSLCRKLLSDITTAHFARYRDERLREVQPQTFKRQVNLLRNIFNVAKQEWDIPVANPLANLKLKYIDQRRERRLMAGELDKLVEAASDSRNPLVKPLILLAIETGMRRGELLSISWEHVSLSNSYLTIPVSKNGHSRTIPLTDMAREILMSLELEDGEDQKEQSAVVFPMTGNALRKSWDRICVRAGIDNLNFHDLRHEAISRFFEMGLNIAEVAAISGHKDVKMLFRYTHPKVGDILNKISLNKINSI